MNNRLCVCTYSRVDLISIKLDLTLWFHAEARTQKHVICLLFWYKYGPIYCEYIALVGDAGHFIIMQKAG